MEIWQAINSAIMGMVLGAIWCELWNRGKVMKEVMAARSELSDSVGSLNTLHNELSQKLIELQEKVAAHEYQLTAKVAPKRPPNPFERPGK